MISIVVCSHNGAKTLTRTFDALDATHWPDSTIEIIFVDNASTDTTAALIPDTVGGKPVRKVYESRKGKSFALNTAIRISGGDYIAFLDDDVRVDPNWLSAYMSAIDEHPDTIVFCGQIRPDFESPAPAWLTYLCDLGSAFGTTPINRNTHIQAVRFHAAKGGNMMIRSAELKRVLFDETNFNYVKGHNGGEDTYLVKQLSDNTNPPLFVPNAVVHHWISDKEATLSVLSQRYRRIGYISEYRNILEGSHNQNDLEKSLKRFRRRMLKKRARRAIALLFRNEEKAAKYTIDIAMLSGRIELLNERIDS